MNRPTKQAARAGVTAVGVAGALMLLATTGQTTDGFVHANLGSPLGLFGDSPADSQAGVIAIGDGPSDATELATLLNVTSAPTAKPGPLRVSYEAVRGPNVTELKIFPTTVAGAAPISDQSLTLPNKPVVDFQGHIDCSGAVSCQTNPATNITTVTYPDGLVALVQKINDTTVVAYKTITDALPDQLQNLFPSAPAAPMPAASAPAASSTPLPSATASVPAPATVAPTSAVPLPDVTVAAPALKPRLTVTSPPSDFTPGKNGTVTGNPLQIPTKITNPVDVVKDAFGSVVNSIGSIVNDALKPGNHNGNRTKTPSSSNSAD